MDDVILHFKVYHLFAVQNVPLGDVHFIDSWRIFCRELYAGLLQILLAPIAGLVNRCGNGFFHTVALAFDFDQIGVVQEAIQDGSGGGNIADEFALFFQGAVGGHQRRAQFVAAHDDLEEVLARFGG